MSYLALARKWRPRHFNEVVGQEHVVKALTHALAQQRLHHAYLFTGTRGVGKTTLARILAKALNCETGISATPCGQCTSCTEIDSGRFMDLLELDAASHTQVDNMRDLLENAQYAPTRGRYKVYIIDEAHMLSKPAFNAMLKTLEEPPQHVKFILATTDPQKIPVTVLSRCLQFNLKQMPVPAIVEQMRKILQQEGLPHENSALPLLARSAQGSMRDALSLLDQAIAHGGGAVREQDARQMLGSADQAYLLELLEALANTNGTALIRHAQHMLEHSISFENALQELGVLLHQIALAQTIPTALDEDMPHYPQIMELARRLKAEDVQLYYQIALHGRRDMSLAPDEYAGFTMTLMRMLAFTLDTEKSAQPGPPPPPFDGDQAKNSKSAVERVETKTPLEDAPLSERVGAAPEFNGDWLGLVSQLRMGGMARMLAQHCELKHHAGQRLELCVEASHRHLLEKPYQDRLKTALQEYFGHPLEIIFSLGETNGMTPVQVSEREKQAKQSEAIAAIEGDPFVRELIDLFDAQIIESSIKPTQ